MFETCEAERPSIFAAVFTSRICLMTWCPFSVLIEFSLWLSAICIRQPSPHCPSGRREGMCANVMPGRIVVFWNRFSCDLRSYLEPAIYGFKSLKRIQELPAHLAHRFRLWSELLACLMANRMRSMATRAWYAISNSMGVG
jgi:hypothetical protein